MNLYSSIPVPKCPACKAAMPFEVPNGREFFVGEPVSRCGVCGVSVRLHLCGCVALDGKTHRCRAKLAPHYAAIVEAARAKGWPAYYETDVSKVDRAHLAELDPLHPFAWGLRESGSSVTPAGPRERPAQYGNERDHDGTLEVQCMADTFGETAWYFWDGFALIACSLAEVKERLRKAYLLRAAYECAWIEENGKRDVISRTTGAEWLANNRESFDVDDLPARVGDELRFGGGAAPLGALRRVA